MDIKVVDARIPNDGSNILMEFNLELSCGGNSFKVFNVKLIKDLSCKTIISFHKYLTNEGKTFEVFYPTSRGTRDRITKKAMEVYNEQTRKR